MYPKNDASQEFYNIIEKALLRGDHGVFRETPFYRVFAFYLNRFAGYGIRKFAEVTRDEQSTLSSSIYPFYCSRITFARTRFKPERMLSHMITIKMLIILNTDYNILR